LPSIFSAESSEAVNQPRKSITVYLPLKLLVCIPEELLKRNVFSPLLLSEEMISWHEHEDTKDKLCSWGGQPAVKYSLKKEGGRERWLKWQFYGNMSENLCT